MLRRSKAACAMVLCPPALLSRVRNDLDRDPGSCRVLPADDDSLARSLREAGEWVLLAEGELVYDPRLIAESVSWSQSTALVDSAPDVQRHPRPQVAGGSFAGLLKLRKIELLEALRTGASILEPASITTSVADLTSRDVEDLPRYSRALRRELRPYWLPIADREDTRTARRILAAASGKGHQEWWVLLFNRPVEQFLSYYVAEWRITPNQITFISNITAYATTALFWFGNLWPGLAFALMTAVLDGLDGRQARIQIKTSKVGEWEHVFDAISELSWMAALCWSFSDGMTDLRFLYAGIAWFAFYGLDNYAYTFFRIRRNMMLDEASRLDAAIRLVASRRNTSFAYFAIALAAGYPAEGLLLVVGLHGFFAFVHWIRIVTLLQSQPRDAETET